MIYLRLMKVFLKENFSLRRLIGSDIRKSKKKAILLGFLMIYALGAYMFSFGLMFFDLGKFLQQNDMLELLLMFVFVYASALGTMIVLFRANGYLFRYKDYELLEPLPIPQKTVILAKMSIMLLMIYFALIIFIAPIAFSYFYHSGFNLMKLIVFLIGFFLIPLIPVIVFSLISLVIARITSRFRKSNLLNIIIMFVVFLGVMALSISMSASGGDNPLVNQQNLIAAFGGSYPPIMWFVNSVDQLHIFSLLWLFLTHAIPLFVFIILIQKLVIKTNQRGLTVVTRKNSKPYKTQVRSVFDSIISKEFRKFFNTPIYAVNSGFGPVILIVLGMLSLFYRDKVTGFMTEMVGLGIGLELIVMIIIAFCVSTIYTSAISLSIEGKKFWILKSMPIEPKLIMKAKMTFNVLLGVPVAWVSIALFGISFQFQVLSLLAMCLFILIFSLTTSAFGSFVNLHFPKFEYMNDTEVVKQSIGAVIGIFGGFGLIIMNGVGFYFMRNLVSWQVNLLLISFINFGLFLAFYLIVNRSASRLFQKMAI